MRPKRRRPTPDATRVHLVRHGEVHNPNHIVYGLLPGWNLSEHGADQAKAAAQLLADRDSVAAIYSSPLQRAVATAEFISDETGAPIAVDERLIEWRLGEHWGGLTWADVRAKRQSEFDTYINSPESIDYIDESLLRLAERMAGAIGEIARKHAGTTVAIISHSDPIKAGVLSLTQRNLGDLHGIDLPTGGIVTLELGAGKARIIDF